MEDTRRFELIIKIINSLKKDNNVLVFADYCKYLRKLQKNVEDSSLLISSSQQPQKRVILTTYAFSSQGVDIPEATALIMATPRKTSMNQLIGRIMRNYKTNKKRYISCIIDNHPIFKRQSEEREKLFIARKYKIINHFIEDKFSSIDI